MRRRSRLLLALGVAVSLTLPASGCSTAGSEDRRPGDRVTEAEAQSLARLLYRNQQRGGADFVVTAPYSDAAMLTLTGEIDFRHSVGRAQVVTSFSEGREDDTRTVFFSPEHVWFGDVPGLADALADAGAVDAAYLRRPVTTGGLGEEPLLIDVLIELLLNLSAGTADEPDAFLGGGYAWLGQRSVDSQLTSLFSLHEGRTVAVAASGDLLTQFVTPLPGTDVDVTVTLSDHGPRRLDLPADEETAEADEHPGVAAGFGV
jgi:hypothetical protein